MHFRGKKQEKQVVNHKLKQYKQSHTWEEVLDDVLSDIFLSDEENAALDVAEGLLEISYPGEFVPWRIRTQNDWVRILWLIRTRIIQRLYITFILIIYYICKLYLCFIPKY